MNILDLPLRELRVIQSGLHSQIYKHPHLSALKELYGLIKKKQESHPFYQKGLAFLEEAQEKSGLDSGYARAEDYYFAVEQTCILEEQFHENKTSTFVPTGKKFLTLVLCFKWNWWMNGESYLDGDGAYCRNFRDFVPKDLYDLYQEKDSWGDDPEVLRKALLVAGMEEKSELIKLNKVIWDASRLKVWLEL